MTGMLWMSFFCASYWMPVEYIDLDGTLFVDFCTPRLSVISQIGGNHMMKTRYNDALVVSNYCESNKDTMAVIVKRNVEIAVTRYALICE
ncbi:hypothetical protein HA50_17045 [Pantoea cypripedii]|uniref:Uncharacterized protein n=1 Tax=Pantoea cypripedii TaxID=55209 RepID=A0A1X1EY70_PANCY|nr:hypothetical protein HA50_17045 [Pantoea cypripedii]